MLTGEHMIAIRCSRDLPKPQRTEQVRQHLPSPNQRKHRRFPVANSHSIHLVSKLPQKPQPLNAADIAAEVLTVVRDCEQFLTALAKFFGNVPLEQLANADLLRAYQLERSKTCAAYTVNKELSCVQQL